MIHEPPRNRPVPTQRRNLRWLGPLMMVMGLLLAPGLCTLAFASGRGAYGMVLGLAAGSVFVVAGLMLLDNPAGPSAPQARDAATARMVTERSLAASARSMTPRQRAANRAAVLFHVLLLVRPFLFRIFGR